jgi:hypothetical protein
MTTTTGAATALAAWRASGGVAERLDPIERARRNPSSRALAIKAKCFDCVGRGADPGWRWWVGNCTADCPLVPLRPYQSMYGAPPPVAVAEHATATPAPRGTTTEVPADRPPAPRPPWEE